jgi:hypothetical protein
MPPFRTQDPMSGEGSFPDPSAEAADSSLAIGAVREDIRQTLRMGWVDPAVEALAGHPVFFTAAWSAMRPNVGKSFLVLTRAVRTQAAEAIGSGAVTDLRKQLGDSLAEEEFARIEDCVRAAHLAMAKMQIVVHAFHRAVRRDRVRGTGREESPIRRGVPDWQRWMAFQPAPDGAQETLDRAGEAFGLPSPPAPLRLLARWPAALQAAWSEVERRWTEASWEAGASRLRRAVLAGIDNLPHPIELQWPALKARGFVESDRLEVAGLLAPFDAAMPRQTMTAAILWMAFGAPEIGAEA